MCSRKMALAETNKQPQFTRDDSATKAARARRQQQHAAHYRATCSHYLREPYTFQGHPPHTTRDLKNKALQQNRNARPNIPIASSYLSAFIVGGRPQKFGARALHLTDDRLHSVSAHVLLGLHRASRGPLGRVRGGPHCRRGRIRHVDLRPPRRTPLAGGPLRALVFFSGARRRGRNHRRFERLRRGRRAAQGRGGGGNDQVFFVRGGYDHDRTRNGVRRGNGGRDGTRF